jgi:hypothetical protein
MLPVRFVHEYPPQIALEPIVAVFKVKLTVAKETFPVMLVDTIPISLLVKNAYSNCYKSSTVAIICCYISF